MRCWVAQRRGRPADILASVDLYVTDADHASPHRQSAIDSHVDLMSTLLYVDDDRRVDGLILTVARRGIDKCCHRARRLITVDAISLVDMPERMDFRLHTLHSA